MDIQDIPNAETDDFEFKSSETSVSAAKAKLSAAASGFSNSGGGCFVLGLDDNGMADGGWPVIFGRQSVHDWIDQIVHSVEPAPIYEVVVISEIEGRGSLNEGRVVLAIKFKRTSAAPHMAPDKKYYIRADAHTVPARSFVVEALWAKRGATSPRLTHLVRLKPQDENVLQLGVVAVTNEPALNVSITLNEFSEPLEQASAFFPLRISMIDKNNPVFFDIAARHDVGDRLPQETRIIIDYNGLDGHVYQYDEEVEATRSVGPLIINVSQPDNLVEAVKQVAQSLKNK